MRYFVLTAIRLYWLVIPPDKRRKCIFKRSCSKYVFDTTSKDGFWDGNRAFRFRIKNCNADFDIITDYKSGIRNMRLKDGVLIDESEIAERLL